VDSRTQAATSGPHGGGSGAGWLALLGVALLVAGALLAGALAGVLPAAGAVLLLGVAAVELATTGLPTGVT
jgi:hypothetical protein